MKISLSFSSLLNFLRRSDFNQRSVLSRKKIYTKSVFQFFFTELNNRYIFICVNQFSNVIRSSKYKSSLLILIFILISVSFSSISLTINARCWLLKSKLFKHCWALKSRVFEIKMRWIELNILSKMFKVLSIYFSRT